MTGHTIDSANSDLSVQTRAGSDRTTVGMYGDLSALPAAQLQLLEETGRGKFYLGADWFRTLIDTTFEAGAAPRIYTVDEAGRPALIFLARTPAGQNGSMLRCTPGRTSLASLTNYQTDMFAPILAPDVTDGAALFDQLAAHICAERPRWNVVHFNYLDASSAAYGWLVGALRRAGLFVRPYVHCNQWYENTEGRSFSTYLAARPATAQKVIHSYARKTRKLERSGAVRHEIYTGPDIDVPLAHYQQVYAASWKEPEPFPEFVPRLLRAAAAAGTLRMGILYLDDQPIATAVFVASGGRATLVKTAYDPKHREVSVGSLIIMRVMQHLLDVEGVKEIGFGAFDAPYKSMWVSGTRELRGILAFNLKTPRGVFCLGQELAVQAKRAAAVALKRQTWAAAAFRPGYEKITTSVKAVNLDESHR